jgi:hypothetical protein
MFIQAIQLWQPLNIFAALTKSDIDCYNIALCSLFLTVQEKAKWRTSTRGY